MPSYSPSTEQTLTLKHSKIRVADKRLNLHISSVLEQVFVSTTINYERFRKMSALSNKIAIGLPGMAAYAASKAGLIGLTQALASEFGPKGYPGERPSAGWHGHADGTGFCQDPGHLSLCSGSSRTEAYGFAGRDREISPLSCIRCVELHHQFGAAC